MSKKAILCVDDERMILTCLRDQLSHYFGGRYLYEFAESADEAWEVIEELDADDIEILIVVSDWLMPKIKGDEFLIELHHRFPNMLKVMLTGQADDEAIERAREKANLHACLSKPWDASNLIAILESGLEESNE